MSRYDLANYLGLSLGTVSRLFTTFQTQGLLRLYKRYFVESLDVAALRLLTVGPRQDGEILHARTSAIS
jgi:CRP/FNR family transcriptional regulator